MREGAFMRLPVTSETDAFRLTCAIVLAVLIVGLVGWAFGNVAGGVVFAVIVAAALIWELRGGERRPLLEPWEAGRGNAGRRVLVIANETPTSDKVWNAMGARDGHTPVVEVLAPVLQSRTHFMTTDVDRETEAAHRRLDATVACARRHGLVADGEVGDPINPLQSLADELRRYEVEEVIVATHDSDHRNWLEDQMLERIREDVPAALTHLVVSEPATAEIPSPPDP